MGPGSAAHRSRTMLRIALRALRCVRGTRARIYLALLPASYAQLHLLAARRARALRQLPPSKVPRAQGRPGAGWHPRSTVRSVCFRKAAQRHTGETKHPAFPAQWFYGLCRALPGERCTIAPVALRMADARTRSGTTHHRKPWRTDPGRQDHTILPYAGCARRVRASPPHGVTRPANHLRATLPASTTSHPAFVTIATRPSARVGVAETCDNSEF
ncbi:hypothetical protein ACVIIV_005017 [Bradyrhizobium sp. USDA 4354]